MRRRADTGWHGVTPFGTRTRPRSFTPLTGRQILAAIGASQHDEDAAIRVLISAARRRTRRKKLTEEELSMILSEVSYYGFSARSRTGTVQQRELLAIVCSPAVLSRMRRLWHVEAADRWRSGVFYAGEREAWMLAELERLGIA